jgi:hypothetical protein
MADVVPVSSESQASASLFPAIADYAFLSNCEQSCLEAVSLLINADQENSQASVG